MKPRIQRALAYTLCGLAASTVAAEDPARLVAALLGSTPLEEDLRFLTDEIGGRPTGSQASGLGPFTHLDVPVVGTDNYDFMMEGVGNLVANQESANYGPNYHARSDTFDKVDLTQLRLNTAIAAAVAYGFAEMDVDWKRQTRSEIHELVDSTSLGQEMRTFALWDSWVDGKRGRRD